MRNDLAKELNENVFRHLTSEGDYMYRKNPQPPMFGAWNSMTDPYRLCGCHPEVVQRLWDQLGTGLPADSRSLVYGNPALVHPESKVIFGVGLGTWYGLRLPGTLAVEAIKAGAITTTKFSTGDMDIRRVLGADWVFGGFQPFEMSLCFKAYQKSSVPDK